MSASEDNDDNDEGADIELEDKVVSGDEDDELDPAVQASDQTMVKEIMRELNGEEVEDGEGFGELHQLTEDEVSLGQSSLSKV